MTSGYFETIAASRADPEKFFAEAASKIDWFSPWERVFDPDSGVFGRWFTGATCNMCYNALDRHVASGRADQVAMIYDSPVTNTKKTYSYRAMLEEVTALAAVLRKHGVTKGDRVIIYMPMVPEAAFAMLACARLGAIHSVVFGGFAAKELATRLDDASPKVVISSSCGIEPTRIVDYKPLLDAAIEMSAAKPDACIILQREQKTCDLIEGRDFDYRHEVEAEKLAETEVECVPVLATDPLYILYTSGTTGRPKGVVRDTGGYMVMLHWTMWNEYGIAPGEVFWTASDVGWVVGHSYIVYAPLLAGVTTVLYEGKPVGTPDAGAFWRVISEHGVVALFTAPTAFRAIKKEDPEGRLIENYDLSKFRMLFLAGERADPDTIKWAERKLNVPVIDHWWQTESGAPISHNPVGQGLLPVKYGSPGVEMPGFMIEVLDDAGHPVEAGTLGNVVLRLPLPPGALPTLWNAETRFHESYLEEFPGYYKTADAGFLDEDGYVFIMSRTDDIINVAGHRLSTGGMEEIVGSHPDVAECAVIGVADAVKGQSPLALIVLNSGVMREDSLIEAEVVALVRDKIGAVASLRQVIVIKRLPKTRSGKILRATMQKIADQDEWQMPATIDDPAILDEIGASMATRGLAAGKPG